MSEILPDGPPVMVSGDARVDLSADFGVEFTEISNLLFTFEFIDDLFDPDDQFTVGVFPAANSAAFGARNVSDLSLDSRSFSINETHDATALFLDGMQDFQFWVDFGSVTLAGASLTATGELREVTAIPEPSSFTLLLLGVIAAATLGRRRTATQGISD